jgi:putative inorganic carbon (hco3(-)) transporter
MNRFNYAVMIIGIFCAAFIASIQPARAASPVYPTGLNGPSDIASGIYSGDNAGDCCWMGAAAQLKLSVPRGADTLLLNVYIPRFAAPRNGQTLRVRIGGEPLQTASALGPGEHELLFRVSGKSNIADVRIRASSTFVPKNLGLNQDPRHLSVLLRMVAFQNSVTGERFDSAALPWLPPRAALALLAIAGAIILLLTLRRPIWGVAALVLTDPFLFAYAIGGTTVTLPKVALLAVAAGLVPRLSALRGGSRHTLLTLFVAQALIIATMLAAIPHAAFHGAALRETLKAVQFAATLLVAYAAYRLDSREDAVRLLLAAITILVTLLAFAQLYGTAMESEIIAGHTLTRIAGPLEGPNQLAGFLGVLVPAMLAFALWKPALLIERAAIALGSAACLMTFSRAGVAALVLACAVLIALRYRTQWRNAIGVATAAAFFAILALAFGVFSGALHGHVQSLFGPSGDEAFNGGLGSRVDLWHAAYAMWRSHPLLGIGPGNFEYAVGRYDPGVRTHANGMYFQVLAEQGIAGFVAMLALAAASIGVFLRRPKDPLAYAALGAAIAMAFHQLLDCMFVYPKVGVIWWIVMALGAATVDLREASRFAEAQPCGGTAQAGLGKEPAMPA